MEEVLDEYDVEAMLLASSDSEDDGFDHIYDDAPGDSDNDEGNDALLQHNLEVGTPIPNLQNNNTRHNIQDELKNIEWVGYSETNVRCKSKEFSGQPGLKVQIEDYNDPYELFRLFITDELIDTIVTETNRYAEQFLAYRPLLRFSRFNHWKPTDADEIMLLLAIYIILGLIWKPKVDGYFTKKPLFSTPGLASILSLRRLKLLNRFLHFSNNEMPNQNKKFSKIKPVFDYICKRFVDVYTPEKDVSIDESLLLWKGRLSFMQYIRIKRARFGIKTYVLSEAKSGYIWKLIVYVGSETELLENSPYGHATNVIMTLMQDLLGKGYCVYADNFYCSPESALALHKHNTDIVGTVRSNRKGLPKDILKKKLNKNELTATCEKNGKMMFVKWADKRDVTLLSSKHELEYTQVKRRGKDVLVPNLVQDYNLFMGGVDKVDQMLSAYPVERKRQKIWYKKEFRHLLNMCIFNAHTLHVKCGGKMEAVDFRTALVEKIVNIHLQEGSQTKKGRPSLDEDPLRLKMRHFPEYVPRSGNKLNPQRRCIVCSSHKVRKESRFQCSECDVGLCAAPCFKIFHTQKNF